jgi:hypothetical protein
MQSSLPWNADIEYPCYAGILSDCDHEWGDDEDVEGGGRVLFRNKEYYIYMNLPEEFQSSISMYGNYFVVLCLKFSILRGRKCIVDVGELDTENNI